LYEVSKDGIWSNWLYSSSSTTFSIPTTLFQAKLFESRGELELLLNLNVWDYVKLEFEKSHKK
jgi:hypothetical protein